MDGTVYEPPYKSIVGGDANGLLEDWELHFELGSALFVAYDVQRKRIVLRVTTNGAKVMSFC